MKINSSNLYVFVVALLLLVGCASEISPTPQVASPSLTSSPVLELPQKPSGAFPATLTPVPNMQVEKISLLVEKLQNANCKLPCYLGITPGKTKLQEGITILENLGGIYFLSGYGPTPYQRKTDGAYLYTYQFGIGEPLSKGKIISHSVTLITNNDMVQAIEATAHPITYFSAEPATETYQSYWKRYTAKEIFFQLGEPEYIYLDSSEKLSDQIVFQLILIYTEQTKQTMQIYLSGFWQDNKICPNDKTMHTGIHMYLSHLNPSVDINEIHAFSMEDVFGVTSNEFYEQVLADPLVCFELRK